MLFKAPQSGLRPGLASTIQGIFPPQIGVSIDADRLYAITDDESKEELGFLEYMPFAIGYHLGNPRQVLVLEPGGGLDVLTALYFGASEIDVIERNPDLVEIVRKPAPNFTTRIYDDPAVRLYTNEPRSFLKGADKSYDMIISSSLHTLGASVTFYHGLSEEYSVTINAMEEYYQHLKTNGWLMITRFLEPVPIQNIRLAADFQDDTQ